MAQIAGKYQLVENKNVYEFFLGVGAPEDKAKEGNEIKGLLEISVDGDKITMTNDSPKYVANLVVGKEVDERIREGVYLKSTAVLDGNVLTVTSTKEGKPAGTRSFNFSDSGLEITLNSPKDGKTFSATRIYKRI